MRSRYCSGRSSLPLLRYANDMMCQCTSRSRTSAAFRIQREVSHAQGHSGSNQKPATVRPTAVPEVVDAAAVVVVNVNSSAGGAWYNASDMHRVPVRPVWPDLEPGPGPDSGPGQVPSLSLIHI